MTTKWQIQETDPQEDGTFRNMYPVINPTLSKDISKIINQRLSIPALEDIFLPNLDNSINIQLIQNQRQRSLSLYN